PRRVEDENDLVIWVEPIAAQEPRNVQRPADDLACLIGIARHDLRIDHDAVADGTHMWKGKPGWKLAEMLTEHGEHRRFVSRQIQVMAKAIERPHPGAPVGVARRNDQEIPIHGPLEYGSPISRKIGAGGALSAERLIDRMVVDDPKKVDRLSPIRPPCLESQQSLVPF